MQGQDLKEEIVNLIKISLNDFETQNRAFSLYEIMREFNNEISTDDLLHIISRDHRFMQFGDPKSPTEIYFISKRLAFEYFLQLNEIAYSTGGKTTNEMLPLEIIRKTFYLTEVSQKDLNKIYEWAEEKGLIEREKDGKLHFHLADLLIIIQRNLECSLSESLSATSLLVIDGFNIEAKIEEIIYEFFQHICPKSKKYLEIFFLRRGLQDGYLRTLESVGQRYNLTRERVRQIEKKIMDTAKQNKRKDTLLICLFLILIKNLGKRIYSQANGKDFYRLNLICSLFNIPFIYIKEINKWILGVRSDIVREVRKVINNQYYCKNDILSTLISIKGLYLRQKDIKLIGSLGYDYFQKKTKYKDIVYIAMKKLRKPASYIQIANECKQLFPGKNITPRNVLAVLSHYVGRKSPWVWTGKRGIYALKEWGYTRPSKNINDEIYEIVSSIHKKTRRPVPLNIIYAEFSKRRKIFNMNSFNIAVHSDKRLRRIGKDLFIPNKKEGCLTNNEIKEAEWLDELDRALRENSD